MKPPDRSESAHPPQSEPELIAATTPRLRVNFSFNALQWAWPVVLNLVLTPVLVRQLGVQTYGTFAILSAAVAFLGFVNSGMGSAVVKFASEAAQREDWQEFRRIRSATLLLLVGAGVVGATAILVASGPLVESAFDIPSGLQSEALWALRALAIFFALRLTAGAYAASLGALQRYDVLSKARIGAATLLATGQMVLVSLGYGLLPLALWIVVVELWLVITLARRVVALEPREARGGASPSRALIKNLLSFSAFRTVEDIATIAMLQGDRLVIGAYLGSSGAAYYSVPQGVAQNLSHFVWGLVEPLFPRVSQLHAAAEETGLRDLYLRALRLISWLIITVAVPLWALATPALSHWVGAEIGTRSAPILRWLLVGWSLMAVGSVALAFNLGLGRPRTNAGFRVGVSLIFLTISLFLVRRVGSVGVGQALVASALLGVPALLSITHRRLGVSVRDVAPMTARLLGVLIVVAACGRFAEMGAVSLAAVVGLLLGLSGLSVIAGTVVGLLSAEDREFLRSYLRRR